MSFQNSLQFGRIAEGVIAQWLASKGLAILPAYEIEKSSGKGPQLFTASNSYVSPDMLAIGPNMFWAEAKHKSVFTWYRKTSEWTTGIDLRHYEEYLKVQEKTSIPVWVFFYHMNSVPSFEDRQHGCPANCPTGLFGAHITHLRSNEHHRCHAFDRFNPFCSGHGQSGMVYWNPAAFTFHASVEEICEQIGEQTPQPLESMICGNGSRS